MTISRSHGRCLVARGGTLQAVQTDPLEAESHEQRQASRRHARTTSMTESSLSSLSAGYADDLVDVRVVLHLADQKLGARRPG